MNDLKIFYDLYKPYRVTNINNCVIMETMDGKYVIKKNSSIDYKNLYRYLYSRGFDYLPKLIDSDRSYPVFEYQEDIQIDDNQKAIDMIKVVGLLHSKTCYFKEVVADKYKEIYDDLRNNALFLENYYNDLFDKFLYEEAIIPSHYLFLNNFSIFYGAIKCLKDSIESWYLLVKDMKKMRVCINHNNLKKDHYIRNDSDYLISWDHYIIDTPVFDFYTFYSNEWDNFEFENIYTTYQNIFSYLDHEMMLLCIIMLFGEEFVLGESEYENCRLIRKKIDYLNKTYSMYKLIWPQKFEEQYE